jgi:predicted transcriptional regulator
METTRSADQQIAFALRRHEAGASMGEISRKPGIAEQTLYRDSIDFAEGP